MSWTSHRAEITGTHVDDDASGPANGSLVAMLACPDCEGDLRAGKGALQCTHCERRIPLLDGIPEFVTPDEAGLSERPRLYDAVQIAFGGGRTRARVARHLTALAPMSVLDVGGGTGFYAASVPTAATYVVADTNLDKLRWLQRRHARAHAVLADARRLPVRDNAVDVALFIAVAHHLADDDLDDALSELARVARRHVFFIDPIASPRRGARALWALDRGSFPRSAEDLAERAQRCFDIEHTTRYSIHHDYVLWVGVPRPASAG